MVTLVRCVFLAAGIVDFSVVFISEVLEICNDSYPSSGSKVQESFQPEVPENSARISDSRLIRGGNSQE
jgi:hypothetical protein